MSAPAPGCPNGPASFRIFKQEDSNSFYGITVDAGGHEFILCADMYRQHAEWLLRLIYAATMNGFPPPPLDAQQPPASRS